MSFGNGGFENRKVLGFKYANGKLICKHLRVNRLQEMKKKGGTVDSSLRRKGISITP